MCTTNSLPKNLTELNYHLESQEINLISLSSFSERPFLESFVPCLVLLPSCYLETSLHHQPVIPLLLPLVWTSFLDHKPSNFLVYFLILMSTFFSRFLRKSKWDINFLRHFIAENIYGLSSFLETHSGNHFLLKFWRNWSTFLRGLKPSQLMAPCMSFFFLEIVRIFILCLEFWNFMTWLRVGVFSSIMLETQWSLNLEIKLFQSWNILSPSPSFSYYRSCFLFSLSLRLDLFGCWAS